MAWKNSDQKHTEENTEFVKEAEHPKKNFIFQKSGITKTGFFITLAILLLLIIGIAVSGVFFTSSN